jgi:hypothetical protein
MGLCGKRWKEDRGPLVGRNTGAVGQEGTVFYYHLLGVCDFVKSHGRMANDVPHGTTIAAPPTPR